MVGGLPSQNLWEKVSTNGINMTGQGRQSTIKDFFKVTRGENLALTEQKGSFTQDAKTSKRNPIPSDHNGIRIRKLKQLWQNKRVVTYNVESLRGTRLQEIVVEAETEKVDILICIGTRGNYSGDARIGNFKAYFEGHGEGGTELMTGIVILIHQTLITKGTIEKKWVGMQGRILMVRIKNEGIDTTIVGAYAPGDHLAKQVREKFWKALGQSVRAIPRRSSRIIGMDANGHIGRDGIGGIGNAGQERWTNNGHELEKFVNDGRLVALNTISNCINPQWTWQKRDGSGRGRIDYLIIDHWEQNLIQRNWGARDLPKWGTQGSAIDHRPVMADITVRTLQEKGLGKGQEKRQQEGGFSARNMILTKAYEAYITMNENQFRQEQKEVGQQEKEWVEKIQEGLRERIGKKWGSGMGVDEMQETIDQIMKEVYEETCKGKGGREAQKRNEHIQEHTWKEIKEKNKRWADVRRWWNGTGIEGWEAKMNRNKMRIRKGEVTEMNSRKEMENEHQKEENELRRGWELWEEWDQQRKKVRQKVRKDKQNHIEECIKRIGKPNGPDNIWKAIDQIAPKKQANQKAVENEKGEACQNTEEEIKAVREFCIKHLHQKEATETHENREQEEGDRFKGEEKEQEEEEQEVVKPLRAEIREAFRHTHHSKSTPEWSIPTKMYVIGEDQLVKPIQEMWVKIGQEDKYPTAWNTQKTVWIPKPGGKGNRVDKRRGITILDGGAKGYLVWLQKQIAQHSKKARRDEYGAVGKRSTAHAIMKVLGVRNRMRKNKVSSITFLGDAVKAFDRIDRETVLRETEGKVGNRSLAKRIRSRHKKMVARTMVDGKALDMEIIKGVAQGDPNGPPMYVNGYRAVLKDIEKERAKDNVKEMEMAMPEWWPKKLIGGKDVVLKTAKTMYVDDHMEIHKIKQKNGRKHDADFVRKQVRQLLEPIFEAQSKVGVESGEEKTVILLELQGKGSQRVKKELGGHIEMEDGRKVKIVEKAKYLGVKIGGRTEAGEQELDERIEKANKAMNRLQNIWRNKTLKTEEKIMVYKTLVTSLMMYATETRIWTNTQIARMEAIQMRHIRRIAKAPAHMTLETNEKLRERLQVFAVTSQLRDRRIKFWANVARNEVEEVVAGIWGKDEEEENRIKTIDEEREKQLIGDVIAIMNEEGMKGIQVTKNNKGEIIMGQETWKALGELKKSQFKKIMTHESQVERRQKNTFGPKGEPTWKCQQCENKFSTSQARVSHVVKAHNYRSDQRKLVQEIQNGEGKFRCLLCDGVYVNKKGAQLHIDRHCAKKFSPEQIVQKLIRFNLL